ncbi:MAG: NTP transferase domain-containing protein [Oligoflexia bacterium]|nr:NTP transferase domain-containing protein [Oligoflexia bacterium]
MQAIILAGGKGTRLKPYTLTIPKPLVPIGDTPILEIVLRQLKYYGVSDVVMAVNHQADYIKAFFQDGKKLGINITYSYEEIPLGTAGPISLAGSKISSEHFLVMNGDLLTTMNFHDFFTFHRMHAPAVSIATYKKEVKIDLGVLKVDEQGDFCDYIEKPTYNFDVSAGMYIFNRSVLEVIPQGQRFELPELILKIKNLKMKISCYKADYFWLDIGRVEDCERADEIMRERRAEFLPCQ